MCDARVNRKWHFIFFYVESSNFFFLFFNMASAILDFEGHDYPKT